MKLYQHQLDGAAFIVDKKRCALFFEMGCGKSATTISAIDYLHAAGEVRRVLVVCPLAIIDAAWRKDVKTFAPHLPIASYHDRPSDRFDHATIGIINFESFRIRCKHIKPPDMLVIDESSRMKDPQSQISKALREFSQRCKYVVLLSGTPAPNDALEYWAQLYAINPKVLGESYYAFRFRYGKAQDLYAAGGRKVQKWASDPDKVPAMLDRIGKVAMTLRKVDCLDLPDKVDEVVDVTLSAEERRAYETMRDDLVLRFSDSVTTADNVLAEIMKLRQLANGWCYDENGKVQYTGRSKITMLLDVLQDIGQQSIIWVEYREDAHRLQHILGERATCLIGGLSDTARHDAIDGFISGRHQYLIAHPQAAGHGLTFVNAHYAVFYGLGYSYEYHQQARDRIHRIGQNKKCTYIYLLSRDTIEHEILNVVRGKADAHKVAMEYLREHAPHAV